MPTVVIAYDLSGDTTLEYEVLKAIDGVKIINTGNLSTPEALEAAPGSALAVCPFDEDCHAP
jgi:hypothetical protein